MSILINYSQEGFQDLKKSQDEIEKKIKKMELELKKLNRMKGEFLAAYLEIRDFFEPSVIISEEKNLESSERIFVGEFTISFPKRATYKINIGDTKSFKGNEDMNLKKLASKLALEKLEKEFPTYF